MHFHPVYVILIIIFLAMSIPTNLSQSVSIHLLLAFIANLFLISWMCYFAIDGNDKSIIILILYYPLLLLANFITWQILRVLRSPHVIVYQTTTKGFILLFLPVVGISSYF